MIRRIGRYVILKELGRGGAGIVYEAIATPTGRKIALKTLLPDLDLEDAGGHLDKVRFLQEARMAARIPRHPGLVRVYEAGVSEGKAYIAMELIHGKALSAWRKEASPSLQRQVQLLRDVGRAIHHAHENGIVHRDLKPANVLVDDEGRPHVTDFGLAQSLSQDEALPAAPGLAVGTPLYMSPEQAMGLKNIGRAADIYSLGVMLYEVLADRVPFLGPTAAETLTQVVNTLPPPPSQGSGSNVDPTLERICLKALAKAPSDRHPSAGKLADDLSCWLVGEKVRVRLPRSSKPDRRIWKVAAAAALLLATFLLIRPDRPASGPVVAKMTLDEFFEAEKKNLVENLQRGKGEAEIRRQPPDAASCGKAQARLKEMYAEEYAGDASRLAHALLQKASETANDDALPFTCLQEASRLAAGEGDWPLSLAAIDALAKSYRVDPLSLKSEVLFSRGLRVQGPRAMAELCDGYLNLLAEAVAAEAYEKASCLAEKAEQAALQAEDEALLSRVRSFALEVRDLQEEFRAAERARASLHNPASQTVLGKYRCFVRGDWRSGLILLRGNSDSDPDLKEPVRKEFLRPRDAAGRVAAGDGWWRLGEKERIPLKKRELFQRAAHWYEMAAPDLAGPEKARIEHRLSAHRCPRVTLAEIESYKHAALRNR